MTSLLQVNLCFTAYCMHTLSFNLYFSSAQMGGYVTNGLRLFLFFPPVLSHLSPLYNPQPARQRDTRTLSLIRNWRIVQKIGMDPLVTI